MAKEEKESKDEKEKKIVILNRGSRTYHTTAGPLPPNGSLELDAKDAENLLGYSDLIDAKKAAPAIAATIEALHEENAKLKAELKNLREDKDEGKKGR